MFVLILVNIYLFSILNLMPRISYFPDNFLGIFWLLHCY